MLRRIPPT
ncbi:TPA: hypothetical protein N0F65_012736 [Lagenidium giganteum]|uniref:Uncharacterized protein n=1 Tax=Lagenidium giganteum TaxID=4803 RepID=A0AAV2YE55_9STRA|nr:TPA: hypothetical protein N0F65_012736 [Lagenidium giganteum]